MVQFLKKLPPEISIALAMISIMLILSIIFGLPLIYPTGSRAGFVGIHYLYPLIGIGVWGVFAYFGQRKSLSRTFFIAFPCYSLVIFAHFNIKLWIPHINPILFDEFYWQIDRFLYPLISACMWIRQELVPIIPYETNFYMISYIAMFYASFCYHAVKTPEKFSELVVAALILQAIGTLGYLLAPALGPFIYEPGVDAIVTPGQQGMLEFYRRSVAEGPGWLAHNGGPNFTVGLAAMPSLHSASAFLFFMFAWKHGKILVPLYSFILFFILITAVATRWHYLIDVPVGIAVAWASLKLSERISGGARVANEIIAPPLVGQTA